MTKRIWKYIVISSVLITISEIQANNLEELFNEANRLYRAEKYEEAVNSYRQILSQGYQSAELYYNLGNCYYRMDRVGEAVLYYEKAHQLDPRDEDIQYNLGLANLRVIDRVEVPTRFFLFDWWDTVKMYFSIYNLTYLLVGLFSLTVVLLIVWLFVKRDRMRRWLLSLSILSAVLTVFWAYIFILRIQEYNTNQQAVVLAPSVTVLSAPDKNSTEVFVLHEGSKVTLDDQRNVWVKISLPDGKTGWIQSDVLGII